MKTGDPKIDMVLALMMPFALNFLLTFAGKAIKEAKKIWARYWYPSTPEVRYHMRHVHHRSKFNEEEGYRMNIDQDNKNDTLIKALKLYLHEKIDIKLREASVDLTEGAAEKTYGLTIAAVLSRCHLVKNPPENQWHKLGQHGTPPALVELMIVDEEGSDNNGDSQGDQGKSKVQVKTFRFRSLEGHAIDAFLDTAYNWYVDELRKSEDISRYYYDLDADESTGYSRHRNSRRQRNYTRFKLSSEKTFDSLFFPEKDSILRLVDNFSEKKGKYAIKVS